MENILLKYMAERFNAVKEERTVQQKNLPFVTISREFGCPAKEVAKIVVDKLNLSNEKKQHAQPWAKLSKEILQAAANELNIEPGRIQKIFNDEKRGTIDEILNALSDKYYQSDRKILKTIDKVIVDFAMYGNVVIIGRGGMSVTRHLPLGIHVRLFAPLEWRLQRLIETSQCQTLDQAKTLSKKIDFKRNALLKSKTNSERFEDDFDVLYNCKYMNEEEISDSIIHLLQDKKLI
mgnify:CR=1 FL=1